MSDDLARDDELGAALRALPVPEHRPGFWDEGSFQPYERTGDPRRRRRPIRLLAIAAVVVVIAGLAAMVVRDGNGGDGDGGGTGLIAGPPGSTVMLTGTLRGELQTGDGIHAFTQEFALAVDGSASLVLTDGSGSQTFDARSRRWWTSSKEGSGGVMGWFLRENVEPQPVMLSSILGGLAVTITDVDGEATTFLGRDAHRYTRTGDLKAFGVRGDADRIELVADDETGVLLHYEATLSGAPVARMEVLDVRAWDEIDRSRFEVDIPASDRVIRTADEHVQVVDLDDLNDIVHYRVNAPTQLEGHRLDSVAVRPGVPDGQSPLPDPSERDRVQLVYRDGWRAIEVVIRRTDGPPPGATAATTPGPIPESTLHVGAFAITVRGALDESRRSDIANQVRPRD
jgi:outer membrane lipoprotein-sorting protein